jgi:hypothetical protein
MRCQITPHPARPYALLNMGLVEIQRQAKAA